MSLNKNVAIVIDPKRSEIFVTTQILKRNGFQVISSSSIDDTTLKKIKTLSSNIVILAYEIKINRHTGIDICRGLNKLYEGKTPIIISCHNPTNDIIKMAIKAGALELIVKPADEKMMMDKIQSVMDQMENKDFISNNIKDLKFGPDMTTAQKVDMVIEYADEIRAMPQAVAKINEISADDGSNAGMMDQAINSDPSIAAMVLKQANSAFYKGQNTITTVKDAVVRIGFSECRSLVMGFSIFNLFSTEQKNFGFNRINFWLHSISVGVIAEHLCKKISNDCDKDAFIAGMLHDFGKLIFDDYMSVFFQKALHSANVDNRRLIDAENEIFEKNHTNITKSILTKWNFSEEIVDGTFKHHTTPQIADANDIKPALPETLFLANQIAKATLLGHGGDTLASPIPNELWKAFKYETANIPKDEVETIFSKVSDFLQFLGISEKDLGYKIAIPKSTGSVAVLANPEIDYRIINYYLTSRGYDIHCVTKVEELESDKGYIAIIACFQKQAQGEDVMSALLERFAETAIICLTGKLNFEYENPSDNIKAFDGNIDFQTIDTFLKTKTSKIENEPDEGEEEK